MLPQLTLVERISTGARQHDTVDTTIDAVDAGKPRLRVPEALAHDPLEPVAARCEPNVSLGHDHTQPRSFEPVRPREDQQLAAGHLEHGIIEYRFVVVSRQQPPGFAKTQVS